MTLIKMRDVAAHFAARRRSPNQFHIVPASLPDLTGLSDKEPAPVDLINAPFVNRHISRVRL
jgi:hypothetical protein